jgi:hypothetical protein
MTNTERKVKFWNRFGCIAPWVVALPFFYTVCSTLRPVMNNLYFSTPEIAQVRKIDENLSSLHTFRQYVSSANISFESTDLPEIVEAGSNLLTHQKELLVSCSNLETRLETQKRLLRQSENYKRSRAETEIANEGLRKMTYLLPTTLVLGLGLAGLGAGMSSYYKKRSRGSRLVL